MTTTPVIEIFAVGSELLTAGVQDTNTFWLCRCFTRLGGRVRRAALLPDDEELIAAEVKSSLLRNTDVVMLTGGLGPTSDDVTLSGVARAAGVPLRLHDEALQMVRERYDALAAKGVISVGGINPGREKMAWLPAGAVPLVNPAGTAPGVMLRSGHVSLVCLPGVPEEMQAIVETSLHDFLEEAFPGGRFMERHLVVACNDESLLDPLFRRLAANHPQVAVKARTGTIEETPQIVISLSVIAGKGYAAGTSEDALERAITELRRSLAEAGVGTEPEARAWGGERKSMIRPFNGIAPKIAASAFISEAAYIVGDVTIGEFATVWPGAVIRGDYAGITIGPHANVEDNCVVHCGTPLVIGREVIVGHGAVIHCARIGDNCLIGSNATLLDGADIGEFSIIGAGSLVPPEEKIPPRSLVMGIPGRIKGRVSDEQVEMLRHGGRSYAEFARKFKEQGL